jgi:ribokinase
MKYKTDNHMFLNRITVIGSSNTDMVIKTHKLPTPGETVLGGKFFMNPGGKGANQAVAAARLGGKVTFVAKTGNDIFGKQSRHLFEDENINIDCLFTDNEYPSGVALITVDSKAENCIVVAPGANGNLIKSDIDNSKTEILASEIILMQLEIPIETVVYATQMAWSAGKKVIINPAPAAKLPEEIYKMLYMLTPNESEAELLTGIKVTNIETAEKAANKIREWGTDIVIITMGSRGALLCTQNGSKLIAAPKVEAVDTTAAGDVFNGALTVAVSEGFDLEKSVEFANKAAAISVTRLGAQSSAPYWKEIS